MEEKNIQKIQKREITDELKESYIDYAMSVIVSRAIPDVRDGLKPVQRRILWAMWDSGLKHNVKFRKSANVVGEVLGKYHPHGDSAVYDAMARMAQDFSLRYPLVDGQGNWGCFTKDTKIKLTDNRNLSFGELVEEYERGKKNYTYTLNSLGLISVTEIKKPRMTIKNAELIKVTLDNGEKIRCTPNHLFMTRDGSYKEAQKLSAGDSLMPLYQRLSTTTDRLNREGYILIYQPKKDEWVPAHHLVDNYNLTGKTYSKNAGRVRHHIDFNKLNNNPDNVVRIHWGDHWKIHYTHAANQHKNPEYRKKIADGRNKYWAKPDTKIKYANLLSERNKKNWQDEQYREKMRRFLSEINKKYIAEHPEKRTELSLRLTQTLKRQWQDPRYRIWIHEKIIKGNKNHLNNKTGKLKFLNICKEVIKRNNSLDKLKYEQIRSELYPYGAATLWETGLIKYFQNDPNLVYQELNGNHKIVKVEKLDIREDVYDLTIEKTHNFALAAGVFVHNSVDGDSPAAMRYTEARLAKISEELLTDIEKETVEWQANYDNSRTEPKFLPAKLPGLLLNGTMGIAVGMATSVPPHNLLEIADATNYLMDNPDASVKDLMKFIPGPDFPTGGVIYDKSSIEQAYATGRGSVTIRGVASVEERKSGSYQIVITEIPYQVNKADLIIKMAELTQEKKIEGIKDLRDESDREGMRITIDLKQDAVPQKVLNQLFEYTELQKSFHFNMVALDQGIQPRVFSLKEILLAYIDHRKIMVRKRAEFDLKKAEERAHILIGLVKALEVIDKIIATIKKSEDKEKAQQNLIRIFKFTVSQANAILEMKLQSLAALERQKLEDELKEKKKNIAELRDILEHPKKIMGIIAGELGELKKTFPSERKTKMVAGGLKEFKAEDLIPQEEAVIMFTQDGYIKRLPPATFKAQKRGGKGLIGFELKEEDLVRQFISADTHDNILFFTDRGRVFQTKVYEIPVASRTAKGKSIYNFLEIPATEKVNAMIAYSDKEDKNNYLVMVTARGIIKKTSLQDFGNVRRTGIIALKLKGDDSLRWATLSSGSDEILLSTAQGQAIRFKEKDVRSMGRTAAGVTAMRLKKGDTIAGLDIIKIGQRGEGRGVRTEGTKRLLAVMANGFGKQTLLKEYKVQRRGGSGIKTAKVTAKTGPVIATYIVDDEIEEVLAFSTKGQALRTKLANIRVTGRATQGVRIINLEKGDSLVGMVCL